eukprot:gene4005-4256_t
MAKAVLAGEGEITLQGVGSLAGFKRLMGDKSLLTVQEPRHRYLRNLVMPAFTNEAIEKLTVRMERVIGRYLDKWASSAQPVVATEEMQRMTFDFIIAALEARQHLVDCLQQEVDEARQLLAAGTPVTGVLGSFLTAVDEEGGR